MSGEPEDRLVLSTRKSLYAPIEITIDDRTYYSKKTTHAVLMEINKLDSAVGKESTEALYKVVRLMFDIEQKVLEKLDKREVEDIYIFAKKKFSEIEKERLKLIISTFGSTWVGRGKEVTRAIPKNQKRSGKKQ